MALSTSKRERILEEMEGGYTFWLVRCGNQRSRCDLFMVKIRAESLGKVRSVKPVCPYCRYKGTFEFAENSEARLGPGDIADL
jgi:tRNA(Ile2) C34 agmatinyltransferase TiaS